MKLYFGFSRLGSGCVRIVSGRLQSANSTSKLHYIFYDLEYPDRMLSLKLLKRIRKKLW